MIVHQIAINFFSKRECQITSNYLAMFMMFAHLAIKERQIASIFFTKENAKWLLQFVMYVLPNKLFKKRIFCLCFITHMGHLNLWNILFMFHHIHVTFKFKEFGAAVSNTSSHGVRAYPWILSKYLSVREFVRAFVRAFVHAFVRAFVCAFVPWDHSGNVNSVYFLKF